MGTFSKYLFSLLLFFYGFSISFCGMNTDSSLLLAPLSYPPAERPSILSVNFVSTARGERQFDIEYYVTNEEVDFLGYNLYISTVPASLESFLLVEKKGKAYLERGVEPSFIHADDPVSTNTADLKTQNIKDHRPPPAPEPFYECLLYFFRLRAYLRGGLGSEASEELQACASSNPSACPSGMPCNP